MNRQLDTQIDGDSMTKQIIHLKYVTAINVLFFK